MAKKHEIKALGRQAGDTPKASIAKTNREEPAPTERTFSSPDPLVLDFDGNHYVEVDLQRIEDVGMGSRPSAAVTSDIPADGQPRMSDTDMAPVNVYVADLPRFLTEKGAIAPPSGPARRFADVLTLLVATATAPPSAQSLTSNVNCFRRPGNVRCEGAIETAFAQDGAILWMCPACESRGIIRHWSGTLWDRSDDGIAH